MDISVVIPLYNEEESLPELFAWIQRVMDGNHFSYEVIFVNDGSTDRSWEVIENLRTQSDKVKGIKFPYNIVMNVGMELEFVTQEVKINEGVTAKDFE